jgi:hypothetical protein
MDVILDSKTINDTSLMFTTNPWAVYVYVAGPVIAGYYLFAVARFYRREITERISSRRSLKTKLSEPWKETNEPLAQSEPQQIDYSQTSDQPLGGLKKVFTPVSLWKNRVLHGQEQSLAEHLTYLIQEAHEKDYDKQELILLLQMTIRDYLDFEGTQFQSVINNCIETECEKYGSIHLGEEDKAEIWNRV